MTRHAAARAIAMAPEGQAIPRETILAALPPRAIRSDSERRYRGTVAVEWGMEDGPAPGEIVRLEFDVENVTKPQPGSLVLAAYHDDHAYRFGPLVIEGAHTGHVYTNLPGEGYRAVFIGGPHARARVVGCAVRVHWNSPRGVEQGVDCPQGVPWGPGWRMMGFDEATAHSVERIDPGDTGRVEHHRTDARGIPF